MDLSNAIKNDIPKKPLHETPVVLLPIPKRAKVPEKLELDELELDGAGI